MDFSDIVLYVFAGAFFAPLLLRGLKKATFPNNIEVITLNGIIRFEAGKNSMFKHIADSLASLPERKHPPKALIVRINSPGGTVGASQELYSTLKKIREKGIKVIACLEDVAASCGVYVAMAADHVVSNPGTITGSIGVIIQGFEYSKVLEWMKIKTHTIKSGKFKDIMSPTREMTNEDTKLLEDVVMDTYEQFVKAVADGRNLPIETVKTFADGRIFNGRQAQQLGLVDELGGFEEAVAAAMKLAQIPEDKKRIGYLDKKPKLFESLSGGASMKLLGNLASQFELSGIPLWLMPKF